MKKILLSTLLITPFIAHANDGMPSISHKLIMVSEEEMNFPKEVKEKKLKDERSMESKGYVEQDNIYAQFLLTLKQHAFDEIRAYRGTTEKGDSHLKQTPKEIKLAFTFKKLPIDDKDIIGYAPVGSYVSSPEGWNGIKAFFELKDKAICAYEFTDLELSNGGVMMSKNNVKYLIHNKPTFTSSEGNANNGYTYSIVWYNDIQVSRLDCATKTFDKDMIEKMLPLAKKIDEKLFS